MSDEISKINGKAEMFYTGAVPWHGFGTSLDGPATFNEAIEAAHLDYQIVSEPIYDADMHEISGYQLIRREDTGEVFRILSERYEISQNRESWSWMDALLGEGGASYHTAGALRGGRVMWVLAKQPHVAEIVPGDPVERYLLLTTSHDGSLALQMHTTPIRVVCANTLRVAMARGKEQISLRHTATIHERIRQAKQALLAGDAYWENMIDDSRVLAKTPMNEVMFGDFVKTLPLSDSQGHLQELFVAGRGQDIPNVRGTAWAAYNAVTEYLDYYSPNRAITAGEPNSAGAQDRRLYRSWYGQGQVTRNRAFRLLKDFHMQGADVFAIAPPGCGTV